MWGLRGRLRKLRGSLLMQGNIVSLRPIMVQSERLAHSIFELLCYGLRVRISMTSSVTECIFLTRLLGFCGGPLTFQVEQVSFFAGKVPGRISYNEVVVSDFAAQDFHD